MNRLAAATSPYLRQHADNPVDWFPWGNEALAKAHAEDKPILLSIGYSACHWCHVMAHESFENPAIASIMNENFVCIKVDREERPDLDDIYMQATLVFTQGRGGWPMTVFLLPDGRPFHAGTYFPPVDGRGMPSFPRVMGAVLDAYRNRRAQVEQAASDITNSLQRLELGLSDKPYVLTEHLLSAAYVELTRRFDSINGGLSRTAPKFPSPMNYEYVLRYYASTGDRHALEIVTFTLRQMARGGIYDQLAGGFARYSTDEIWLVPHFEKMLYDNAQLSRLYLHTWLASRDEFFKSIAVEIYDYILREMTDASGGFFSATDADSEGHEGKFFVWSIAEVRDLLPAEEAEAAIAYWGMTVGGNFEGYNVLHVPREAAAVAVELGVTVDILQGRLARAKDTLYAARTQRIAPGLDDKILMAWNGMMLASLAEAARVLDRDDYRQAAIRCGEFLLTTMQQDGRLLRSYRQGQANYNAYLEDYANLIDGLLQLYQTTFEPHYLREAQRLAEVVLQHFVAPDGGLFDTSDDHERLITRPRNLQDNAMPSGNSMMAKVLFQLDALLNEPRYDALARDILQQIIAGMEKYPAAFGEALNAADMAVHGAQELALLGESSAFTTVINCDYHPNLMLAGAAQPTDYPPLLLQRTLVDGQPTAYLCRQFVCQRPVTEPAELLALLQADQSSN